MYDIPNQFIFTHPIKTGGTSLEELLGFLQLREKYPNVHRFKHANLKEHVIELESKGFDTLNFFKFSIIRNPWARVVSIYNHFKYKEHSYLTRHSPETSLPKHIEDAVELNFKDYILKYTKTELTSEKITMPFLFSSPSCYVDYTIRLENLKPDILVVADRLNLALNVDIPHNNNSALYLPKQNYRDYYDLTSRAYVASAFKWDILTFDYTF